MINNPTEVMFVLVRQHQAKVMYCSEAMRDALLSQTGDGQPIAIISGREDIPPRDSFMNFEGCDLIVDPTLQGEEIRVP